ncbi:hypothetical protein GOP47_0012510 [Adiantum capillus-veneris]|uniref:Uncharacterized protein n=1 Tax=Adiantum capillus-veneris TaxID=13818 RepID=A0A9D4URA3_ADICA|nr:hypothetical protein GOP47_0012510 [Adiantum capillus-veneris]
MLLPNKDSHFSRPEAYLGTFSSITGSTAMPNVAHSTIMQEQASCASKKSKEISLSTFRESKEKEESEFGQGLTKDDGEVAANEFTGSKLDLNSSLSQVSVQMSSDYGSQAGELKMTTNLVKNVRVQKEGNVLLKTTYDLSKERESADYIDRKHPVSITSDTIESINHSDLKPSTLSLSTDINQKEVQGMKSVSHHHASMQSSKELCQSMAYPKPVNSQDLEQVNDLDRLHQEKPKSTFIEPEDIGFYSNGPHLLVECIHNLSKVLLSTESKTSINALSPSDCLVLESTICMLSHRLFQCSAIEANSCEDSNYQQEQKDFSAMKVSVEAGSLQKASSQFAHILSFKRDFQHEVLQNAPKSTAARSMGGEYQSINLMNDLQVSKEELRVLRGELQILQAELGYERAESNATVSIYKDLWSDAQEALKVSQSEMKEIRTEIAGVKRELTNLKLSGGVQRESETAIDDTRTSFKQENSNTVTSSSHGVVTSDLSRPSTEKGNNSCCGGLSKPSTNHTIVPPKNLENDVAQRLSLLLSRQGLDLNKTYTESCMEWSSGSSTSLELVCNAPGEDEAMPPNEDYLVWSETSYLLNGENGAGCSISNFSCQRRHGCQEEEEDCLYGSAERGPNDGDMDIAELKQGICQEDEIEIICFKPGRPERRYDFIKGNTKAKRARIRMSCL